MNVWKRRALIAFFSVGTVGGFASGFAHVRHGCHHQRRAHFEQHVANVCLQAAARLDAQNQMATAPAPVVQVTTTADEAEPGCRPDRRRRHRHPRRGHPPRQPPPEADHAQDGSPVAAHRAGMPRIE